MLTVQHLSKSIGAKTLFTDLDLHINPGEKVALIGRNGQGKTTLLNIIGGVDHDYNGLISKRKNLKTVLTKQEHLVDNSTTALEYILHSVPHYFEYEKVLKDFESKKQRDVYLYTEAVDYFSHNGYYYIKNLILSVLLDFQISNEKANSPLITLSGGEKRFVELVRMMYSKADLLLIDEPTNHMDYIGKEQFINWMLKVKETVLIVTHDRDVLQSVDRIIELKDQTIFSFKGNYDHYLKQNTTNTKSSVVLYHNQLRKLSEAKKRVEWGLQMRAKSKAWRIKYDHWQREHDQIKTETVRPSFWIDQKSVQDLDKVISDSYDKFKEKNIRILTHTDKEHVSNLLTVENLSLGYTSPLFSHISFKVGHTARTFIKGRNSAGKSTLVRTILSRYKNKDSEAIIFDGEIKTADDIRIGEYEQEIDRKYLPLKLEDAIAMVYENYNISISTTRIKSILSQYLFDPSIDARQKIGELSGGQKARFQLIKMFANKPNLLILDEPTNHLDLPSIEELENALQDYEGGILYISHDSSFKNKLGGETIEL